MILVEVLRQACQLYVIKFLHTIRNVVNKSHQVRAEGDFCISQRNNDENDQAKEEDLMSVDSIPDESFLLSLPVMLFLF